MSNDNRILELVEEALCSGRTAVEVCADSPELAGVRTRLAECRRIDGIIEPNVLRHEVETSIQPSSRENGGKP